MWAPHLLGWVLGFALYDPPGLRGSVGPWVPPNLLGLPSQGPLLTRVPGLWEPSCVGEDLSPLYSWPWQNWKGSQVSQEGGTWRPEEEALWSLVLNLPPEWGLPWLRPWAMVPEASWAQGRRGRCGWLPRGDRLSALMSRSSLVFCCEHRNCTLV